MDKLDLLGKAYEEYYDDLLKSSYAILKNVMDAEDAVQDGFELALRYFHTYNPEKGDIKPWLMRITRNKALRNLDANRGRGTSVEFDEEMLEPIEMSTEGEELLKKVKAHIKNVDDADKRSALQLYFIDLARISDICTVCSLSRRSVRTIISNFKATMTDIYA